MPAPSHKFKETAKKLLRKGLSKKAVQIKLMTEGGVPLSLRTLDRYYNEIYLKGEPKPEPPRWTGWEEEMQSPKEAAFLLQIEFTSKILMGRPTTGDELIWAKRIRIAIQDLHVYQQYRFIFVYGLREWVARINNFDRAYTEDLDAVLAYQPWTKFGSVAYKMALEAEIIEPLNLLRFADGESVPVSKQQQKSIVDELTKVWPSEDVWDLLFVSKVMAQHELKGKVMARLASLGRVSEEESADDQSKS